MSLFPVFQVRLQPCPLNSSICNERNSISLYLCGGHSVHLVRIQPGRDHSTASTSVGRGRRSRHRCHQGARTNGGVQQHIQSLDKRHPVVYGPQVVFSAGLSLSQCEMPARIKWAVPWIIKDPSDTTSSPQWVAIKEEAHSTHSMTTAPTSPSLKTSPAWRWHAVFFWPS